MERSNDCFQKKRNRENRRQKTCATKIPRGNKEACIGIQNLQRRTMQIGILQLAGQATA
jgi:hypothetical protein